MNDKKTLPANTLRRLMSEITALREQIDQAERNRKGSIVAFDRLLKSRRAGFNDHMAAPRSRPECGNL